MMFVDLPTHPLFSDFKGTPVTPELMICYPAGAGANFLFNNLQGSGVPDERNEYDSPPSFKCPIDRVQYTKDRWTDPSELESHLWKMYSVAQGCPPTYLDGSPWRFAQFHNVPYLANLVFDLRPDEIVYIEPDADSDWFITALVVAKHGLQPFGSSQFLTSSLINAVISSGLNKPIDPSVLIPYESLLNTPELSGVGNTLIFWSYVIESTAQGILPSYDGFRSHIDRTIGNQPMVVDDYYLAVIDQLSSRAGMQKRIKYSDLYFDLNIPEDGALSRLSKDDIVAYTNDNIKLVRSLVDILTEETAAAYRHKLFEIQRRVN